MESIETTYERQVRHKITKGEVTMNGISTEVMENLINECHQQCMTMDDLIDSYMQTMREFRDLVTRIEAGNNVVDDLTDGNISTMDLNTTAELYQFVESIKSLWAMKPIIVKKQYWIGVDPDRELDADTFKYFREHDLMVEAESFEEAVRRYIDVRSQWVRPDDHNQIKDVEKYYRDYYGK